MNSNQKRLMTEAFNNCLSQIDDIKFQDTPSMITPEVSEIRVQFHNTPKQESPRARASATVKIRVEAFDDNYYRI